MTTKDTPRVIGCRSELELYVPAGELIFAGGPGGGGTLKADRALDAEKRRELIKSVRGGEHVELTVRARTFRQRDGSPNKNFLRFRTEKLGAIAKTFAGVPLLLNHDKWDQRARMGTISASEAVEEAGGWTSFYQTLQVVKPEGVISVLDGTLDRFSIAWSGLGPVLCTVHKTDLRSRNRCSCWPGDRVAVDGKELITEYEFQNAEGTETSGVNTPAASGTRIDDVRQALALELGFHDHDRKDDVSMNFTRLAAILGIAALAAAPDEDHAIRVVEGLKRDKLAAELERDTARTELATTKEAAKTLAAKALATQIDTEIEGAYRAGKLRYGRNEETGKSIASPREERLRRIAKDGGLAELKAEIADMPVIVAIGKRQLEDEGTRDSALGGGEDDDALASAAEQLGIDPQELRAHARQMEG